MATQLTAGRQHKLRGYFYISAAAFLWGISATMGRAAFTGRLVSGGLLQTPIGPLILSQCRTTFSFLTLLSILSSRSDWKRLRLPMADLGQVLLLGVLGLASSNYFYYVAIQRTNVATAIILQYTAPIWVLLYMVARGLQRPTLQRVAAVALSVAGIAMVIRLFASGGFRVDAIGVTAALLAAFSFAFYNVGAHGIVARYDRWTVLLYVTFGGSLFWIAVNPPWKIVSAHYSEGQWLFLLIFSLVSALAPFSLYIAGLQYLDPTRAIVASCLEPVFAILIAAIVLGEFVRPVQTAGMLLVLTAIIVVQMPEREIREQPVIVEPIE